MAVCIPFDSKSIAELEVLDVRLRKATGTYKEPQKKKSNLRENLYYGSLSLLYVVVLVKAAMYIVKSWPY